MSMGSADMVVNADGYVRRGDQTPMSVVIHGKTFHSVAALLAWVSRIPEGNARVDAWVDIVTQLSRFFRGGSHFSSLILNSVRADKLFELCNWSKGHLDDLLETLQAHVDPSKVCRNRCSEALNTINIQWGLDAAASVESKGYFNRTLKLIANVARRSDVPDLATALLLVNTQAVRRLSECKNRYALRRYITPDDWLQVKHLPVPTRQLTLEELADVRVHINQDGEICSGAPFLPTLSPSSNPPPPSTSPPPSTPPLPSPASLPSPAPPPLGGQLGKEEEDCKLIE